MRAIVIILFLAFFTSCIGKQTVSEAVPATNTSEVRDSLESALDGIALRMEELATESERLSAALTPDNPIIQNLEEEYLKLLGQKEEILIQLAEIPDHP